MLQCIESNCLGVSMSGGDSLSTNEPHPRRLPHKHIRSPKRTHSIHGPDRDTRAYTVSLCTTCNLSRSPHLLLLSFLLMHYFYFIFGANTGDGLLEQGCRIVLIAIIYEKVTQTTTENNLNLAMGRNALFYATQTLKIQRSNNVKAT